MRQRPSSHAVLFGPGKGVEYPDPKIVTVKDDLAEDGEGYEPGHNETKTKFRCSGSFCAWDEVGVDSRRRCFARRLCRPVVHVGMRCGGACIQLVTAKIQVVNIKVPVATMAVANKSSFPPHARVLTL